MFELDQAISNWRQQMLAAGIKTPTLLDELESHLRADVERHLRSGVDEREAFEAAVRGLGEAAALKHEFSKAREGRSGAEKAMLAIGGLLVAMIVLLSWAASMLCFESWEERVMVWIAVASILVVACGWRYGLPFLPVIASTRKRWALGITCMLSGFACSSFYCQVILPHFAVGPDHQVPAIGLWAVFLIAIFACAGVGLLMSPEQRETWNRRNPRSGPFRSANS